MVELKFLWSSSGLGSSWGISCLEVVDHEEREHVAGHRGVLGFVHAVLPGPGLERADLTDKVLVQI